MYPINSSQLKYTRYTDDFIDVEEVNFFIPRSSMDVFSPKGGYKGPNKVFSVSSIKSCLIVTSLNRTLRAKK